MTWLLIASTALVPITTSVVSHPIDDEEEETPLHTEMEEIKNAIGKLRRSLRKLEKSEESLEWIAKLEMAAIKAKSYIPAMAPKVPEAERAEFIKSYRKEMIVFMGHILELEKAVLDGDMDKIKTTFKQVRDMEGSSHEKFTEDG